MPEQEEGDPGLAQRHLVAGAPHRRVRQALVLLAPPTDLLEIIVPSVPAGGGLEPESFDGVPGRRQRQHGVGVAAVDPDSKARGYELFQDGEHRFRRIRPVCPYHPAARGPRMRDASDVGVESPLDASSVHVLLRVPYYALLVPSELPWQGLVQTVLERARCWAGAFINAVRVDTPKLGKSTGLSRITLVMGKEE